MGIIKVNMKSDIQTAIANLEKRSASIRKELLKHKSTKDFYTRSTLLAHTLRQKSSQILAGAGLVGTILTSPLVPLASQPLTQISQHNVQQSLNQKQNRKRLCLGSKSGRGGNPPNERVYSILQRFASKRLPYSMEI